MASEMKEKAVTLTNLGVSNISELFKPFIDLPCRSMNSKISSSGVVDPKTLTRNEISVVCKRENRG